jgi:hypothetical protein
VIAEAKNKLTYEDLVIQNIQLKDELNQLKRLISVPETSGLFLRYQRTN